MDLKKCIIHMILVAVMVVSKDHKKKRFGPKTLLQNDAIE